MIERCEKSLSSLLSNANHSLATMQAKVKFLQQLNLIWQQRVEMNLAQHTRVANYRENTLIIEADSPVWTTRLRFLIPDLINQLTKHFEFRHLKKIDWYIRPTEEKKLDTKISKAKLKLTEQNADIIKQTAQTITNTYLQQALRDLAKHGK